MCQISVTQYPADIKESPVTAPEEVASTEVLAGVLDVKAYWGLTSLTAGIDLMSHSSIRGLYECPC